MIKNENGIYYITCGCACYCMREVGGLPYHVCFGRRVEYEDDMSALVSASKPELAKGDIAVLRGGKKLALDLVVTGSKVVQKPTAELPTLRGEKTLVITAEDKAAGVSVELLYTPYSRGGIARRVRVTNIGASPLTVERLSVSMPVACELVRGEYGLWKAETQCGGELTVFPLFHSSGFDALDGRATLTAIDKKISGETVTLEVGETVSSPELVAVYSYGVNGCSLRALHDIVREFGMSPCKADKRRPIVLYGGVYGCEAAFNARVVAACEMGVDTVVLDHNAKQMPSLAEAAACVRSYGIKFGLRVGAGATVADVLDAVKECGAEYFEFVFDGVTSYADTVRLYGAYVKLCKEFPELICDVTSGSARAADTLKARTASPLPLAAVRNTVTRSGEVGSFKTEFDMATLGGLGYKLDPSALDANARRAVRAQIFSYQDDAAVIDGGDVYDIGGGVMVVSKDKSKAYAVAVGDVRLVGLDEHNIYRVRELNKTFSGAALAYYGIPYDKSVGGETVTYHIRQVADYEQ